MEEFEQSERLDNERSIEQDRLAFIQAIKNTDVGEIDTEFDVESVQSLISELADSKLLILGETHGVKENVDVIYTLFKKFGFKKLALEWNKKLREQAEKFLLTGELDFEAIKDSPDGRITAGHFALLKKLKDEGLLEALVCFDEESPSREWDARDADMTKNIIANLSDSAMLVVAGNLHTKITPITFDDKEERRHPMGENVKKQIPNVPSGEIQYFTGEYHNFGIQKFEPRRRQGEDVKLLRARFQKLLKGFYYFELPRAHSAVVPNPSETLKPSEGELAIEKLRNPSYLPTRKDISRSFKPYVPGGIFFLEFDNFVRHKENPIFEFLNEEFLTALSDYISQRIESLGVTEDEPITILEVGAGSGRLTHFLQQKLEQRIPGKVKVIATDSGDVVHTNSGEVAIKATFPVEKFDYRVALEKYQPKIVISSWMPLGKDFSAGFRSTKSVEEYILIGLPDNRCGDGWLTWGSRSVQESQEREGREKQPTPYESDGFERVDVDEVSKYQICRIDDLRIFRTDNPRHSDSETVSFRRKK